MTPRPHRSARSCPPCARPPNLHKIPPRDPSRTLFFTLRSNCAPVPARAHSPPLEPASVNSPSPKFDVAAPTPALILPPLPSQELTGAVPTTFGARSRVVPPFREDRTSTRRRPCTPCPDRRRRTSSGHHRPAPAVSDP